MQHIHIYCNDTNEACHMDLTDNEHRLQMADVVERMLCRSEKVTIYREEK
jgi:hypothetical protein